MKMRRLPEIDLARFAAAPPGPKLEHELRHFNAGGGFWSYDPTRQSTADILWAQTPLLGPVPCPTWEQISSQVTRACNKGPDQTSANLGVSKTLFDTARAADWLSARFDMGRLSIGFAGSVSYWSDVVVQDESGIFIPFFDHRRSNGIANPDARRIVFSMQHFWIRDRYPDLAAARLAVVRFPNHGQERSIRIDFHNDAELLSYDELSTRIRVVYETWGRVSDERARDKRGTGTGGPNPFGF